MAAPRPKPETLPDKPRHDGGVKPAETPPPSESSGEPVERPAEPRGGEGGMIGEG